MGVEETVLYKFSIRSVRFVREAGRAIWRMAVVVGLTKQKLEQ